LEAAIGIEPMNKGFAVFLREGKAHLISRRGLRQLNR
jgi:hypothetical protein